jgi:hypothetical protein
MLQPLPDDIAAAIDRVYKRFDAEFVKERLLPSDRWLPLVKKVADQYVVREETDFNYGRAHVYDVWLTKDPSAGVASAAVETELLIEAGVLESVRMSVSVLAPYYLLSFARKRYNLEPTFGLIPESSAQEWVAASLANEMSAFGYKRLDPLLAETVVPGVETELRSIGSATLADCLIGTPA